ncbi:hypothetical protein C8R44DRAFT_772452 [Mycena epipterygia]|nr:hypothetical protein C8R44DRAFT_772452 [Mycena epipterygia]
MQHSSDTASSVTRRVLAKLRAKEDKRDPIKSVKYDFHSQTPCLHHRLHAHSPCRPIADIVTGIINPLLPANITLTVVDLMDHQLPLYTANLLIPAGISLPLSDSPYADADTNAWSAVIRAFDAFIFLTHNTIGDTPRHSNLRWTHCTTSGLLSPRWCCLTGTAAAGRRPRSCGRCSRGCACASASAGSSCPLGTGTISVGA